jgi:hypothetical protein
MQAEKKDLHDTSVNNTMIEGDSTTLHSRELSFQAKPIPTPSTKANDK